MARDAKRGATSHTFHNHIASIIERTDQSTMSRTRMCLRGTDTLRVFGMAKSSPMRPRVGTMILHAPSTTEQATVI